MVALRVSLTSLSMEQKGNVSSCGREPIEVQTPRRAMISEITYLRARSVGILPHYRY